jgi:WhiB family redox-sensing transcriptional regulator
MTATITAMFMQAPLVEQVPETADVAATDTACARSAAVDVGEERAGNRDRRRSTPVLWGYLRCRPSSAPGPRRRARARSAVGGSPGPIGRQAPEGLPCQVNDPNLWFAEAPADIEFAKALCGTCPVQQLCLAGAIERREPCGVWGGQFFHRGRVVPYKRSRGRPRKDCAPYRIGD